RKTKNENITDLYPVETADWRRRTRASACAHALDVSRPDAGRGRFLPQPRPPAVLLRSLAGSFDALSFLARTARRLDGNSLGSRQGKIRGIRPRQSRKSVAPPFAAHQ